jgi:hypothetical protein
LDVLQATAPLKYQNFEKKTFALEENAKKRKNNFS